MARIVDAARVVSRIGATLPPRPTVQNILPFPAFESFRAAWSAMPPTSAAPEQAKTSFSDGVLLQSVPVMALSFERLIKISDLFLTQFSVKN
jgi:hypothetical protein